MTVDANVGSGQHRSKTLSVVVEFMDLIQRKQPVFCKWLAEIKY